MRQFPAVVFLLLYFAACSGGSRDLVILSKEIRRESLATSAAGAEFGSAAGAVVENVVAGEIRNTGARDALNVEVTFHLTGGGHDYAVPAHIPSVPAGKTVKFQSEGIRTQYTLQFKADRETEIRTGS
ncbi:MAG TPA: hypothetical protein VF889_00600 [Bacteroidota bacterium]